MKAIGPHDIVTVNAYDVVAASVCHKGPVAREIVQLHILNIVLNFALHSVARFVEIARQFCLAIHENRIAAGIFMQVNAVQVAIARDENPFVDLALTIHPFAALRFSHEIGEAVFQHASANSAQHIFAAMPFEHDRIHAPNVQQLGEEQSGRTAADDADMDLHTIPPSQPISPYENLGSIAIAKLSIAFK